MPIWSFTTLFCNYRAFEIGLEDYFCVNSFVTYFRHITDSNNDAPADLIEELFQPIPLYISFYLFYARC